MKIIISFFLGILAAFGALVLETALSIVFSPEIGPNIFLSIGWFLAVSIVIEEILKFAIIFSTVSGNDSKASIFLKSFFIGLGFSSFEIILNLYKINLGHIDSNFAFSLLGIFLIHILTSCYMGYFIAFFKNSKKAFSAIIIIFTVFLHLAYNLATIYDIPRLLIYPFLLALIIIIILRYSRLHPVE